MSNENQEETNDHEEQAILEESTEDVSAFVTMYKYSYRTSSFSQEKRRELFLQIQKEKRREAFDEKRDLSELFTEETEELMDCECSKNIKKAVKKFPFGFRIMDSEWLREAPDDLAENWLIKLCIGGVRYLIVANDGVTTCYFKNGKYSFQFKSNLPGGNSQNLSHKFTVLDCVFSKETKTFLIYDVLAWNSMSLINAEASMRFFWLKSKFEEDSEFCKIRHPKKYKFVVVDFFPAQVTLLQDHLFMPFSVGDNELTVESVLFYHREGHYVSGTSPLVCWLKTFMIPEVLHIDVPPQSMQARPENYVSLDQYLSSKKKRSRNRKSNTSMMDAEEIETLEK